MFACMELGPDVRRSRSPADQEGYPGRAQTLGGRGGYLQISSTAQSWREHGMGRRSNQEREIPQKCGLGPGNQGGESQHTVGILNISGGGAVKNKCQNPDFGFSPPYFLFRTWRRK